MRSTLILIFTFCCITFSNGESRLALLWDHDNGATVAHRLTKRWVGTEKPLMETMKGLGYEVEKVRRLPDNLADYDVVLICLGFLTPS